MTIIRHEVQYDPIVISSPYLHTNKLSHVSAFVCFLNIQIFFSTFIETAPQIFQYDGIRINCVQYNRSIMHGMRSFQLHAV